MNKPPNLSPPTHIDGEIDKPLDIGTALPPHRIPPPPEHLSDRHHGGRRNARRRYVDQLFDASASHYDWINGLLSFGSGRWYRRQALRRAGVAPGMQVLDVGCGTGVVAALAAEMVGPQGAVLALDPSQGMLAVAAARQRHQNGAELQPVQALGEALPLVDACIDRLTMGYALRHVADLHEAFGEYHRVLRPGGQLLLLEITKPTSPLAYYPLRLYLKRVIPALTGLLRRSRDAQTLMSYYWDTIEHCVPPAMILAALNDAGFVAVERHIELGVFSEYRATRPA